MGMIISSLVLAPVLLIALAFSIITTVKASQANDAQAKKWSIFTDLILGGGLILLMILFIL